MKCINQLLKQYLKENGSNKLLHENHTFVTHSELEIKSNQFANYIMHNEVKKYDRVILMMDLHINAIITVFGIIKTGAIYVPIDKTMPQNNVKKILAEVRPTLIICNAAYLEKFRGINCKIVVVEKIFSDYLKESKKLKKINIISNDLLYITYTSGTTNFPKGVMISHRAVMTFIEAVTQEKELHNKSTKTLCRTPLSFDPFLTEILPSIVSGGQVYIQERDVTFRNFIKFIASNKITNFGCGPSLLLLLEDNLEYVMKYDLSSLKEIYIGYEKCPVNVIKKLQNAYPQIQFINGYGTTETFASSSFYKIPKLMQETNVPIGNAIENEQFLILNENLGECKIGEVGELIIRGSSLFSGYWKNPNETKKKLIVNPLFPESNDLAYRTGDLVKMDKKGDIYFIGRKDYQVKINGYRVELGEIQYVINCCEGIKECYVIYHNKKIVCFYNTYKYNNITEEFLVKYCKKYLSLFKIPNKWIKIFEFPRNHNGKIERKKLLELYGKL